MPLGQSAHVLDGGAMPGVAVVSIPVRDQDRAAAFYTEHLGFRVIEDAAMGESTRWLQLAAGDERTTITLVTWFDEMPAGSVRGLVIDVEDPDACQAGLVASGTACSDVSDEPWGRCFTCADPDGNGLVVARTARSTQ
jgi:catechol 2,3-dioxygenase-like lactoylglutathione lyase family enzyme